MTWAIERNACRSRSDRRRLSLVFERDQEEQRGADQDDDIHRRLDTLEDAENLRIAHLDVDRARDQDEGRAAGGDRNQYRRPQCQVWLGD